MEQSAEAVLKDHLVELLKGGFAPVIPLLREFDFDKAGVVLDGLPFSAWSLLEHMRHRQQNLLRYMKAPEKGYKAWPEAYWPENPVPENERVWNAAINNYENDLQEMIRLIEDPACPLFKIQQNGKTIAWAAMTTFHHNAYTIGQVKAIGRQLGVW